MSESEQKLLDICDYGSSAQSQALAARIHKNYSQFDELVAALEDLKPILKHSNFYLSLRSNRDMIKIKNDMVDPEEFMVLDTDIIVWANEHNIELEEGLDEISIIGFKKHES